MADPSSERDQTADPRGVAIVTGAASGIGRATSQVLIERGWMIAGFDRDAAALEGFAATAGTASVLAIGVDVTDETAVDSAVARAEAELGPITGVVNCAGIAADRHVLDTPVDLFRKILDINVLGTFLVARSAARLMAPRKAGSIVNLASVSGLRGNKGRVAYGASKGAVVTLTQVMANDLAPLGIRVNAVAPGPVDTPLVQALHDDDDRKLWSSYVPMDRYCEPREIATVIAFLLDSAQSSYMTGAIVPVDGGFASAGIIVRD